jgi:arylsulfatase A-like enzyme
MNKKNLIILMIDGGRLDRALNSAYFNKLKETSIFFSNSITYGPHTIAAMHAVFSGTYGVRTGTNSYWSTYKFKKEKFKTLTEYLKDENYYAQADIVNELVIPKQGFDKFLIHNEESDDLTKRHCEFLDEMKNLNDSGKNFFLYLQYSNIHTGIMNEVLKAYDNFSKDYFENKEKNNQRYDKLFDNATSYLENILQKISSLNLNKNSIVLIMSDHGISTGEKIGERAYGAFCYDYTLRTFTYFQFPENLSMEITPQIRTIDFLPTILEYLQIPHDVNYEQIDGVSLWPLIKEEKFDELLAFSETGNPLNSNRPPEEPNVKCIRTSNWKLIFNEYNNSKELYDLKSDPAEEQNLIGKNLDIETILWKKIQDYL